MAVHNNTSQQCRIEGTVAPGFESVKRLYEHNMRTLAEESTQLCVYYGGEKVVDLWATVTDQAEFSPDSLVNIFSSGKSLEAIAIASLVGKGLLEYSARVADYWPEFAANGKGELTVAQLMRHEAGLPAFNRSIDTEALLTANIKQNSVGQLVEGHAQTFRKGEGNRREYHAVTRGWIVNELFRRVDPAGRTIGEYLREDISAPLEVDVIVGVRKEELPRVKKVTPLGFWFQLRESLKPKFLKRRMERNIFQLLAMLLRLIPAIRNASVGRAPAPFRGMKRIGFFNEPAVRMGETPSANTHSNARSLAKLAAVMAAGGSWAGREYLSAGAWSAMHAAPLRGDMGFVTTSFTQGGVAQFAAVGSHGAHSERALNTGREGFYGWLGLGGSIFQWHPESRVGFGYVPTSLNVLDLVNERGKSYQAEVLKCVAKLESVSAGSASAPGGQLAVHDVRGVDDDLAGIETLTRTARSGGGNTVAEVKLVQLRHKVWQSGQYPVPPAHWPVPKPAPHVGGADMPTVHRSEFNVEVLRTAINQQSCLLVRGLMSPEHADMLITGTDRALDAARRRGAGETGPAVAPWFRPFVPEGSPDTYSAARAWSEALGTVLVADSPRNFRRMLDVFEAMGLLDLLTSYFGVRPVVTHSKTSLRRVAPGTPGGWHQDVYAYGVESRALNMWVALSPCGRDAPGLALVPTNTGGPLEDLPPAPPVQQLSDATIKRLEAERAPVLEPALEKGDVLFFDTLLPHQTQQGEAFTRDRYSLDCWFFAPTTVKGHLLPLHI